MKLERNTDFRIAKAVIETVFTKIEPLNYEKWTEFVDNHSEYFTWKENTKDGIQILKDIDNVPVNFRQRVLSSLNKVVCYQEFDKSKGYYNINVSFSSRNNWISIGFERKPKLEDLKIFLEMAKNLDAYLLVDGTKIIDDNAFKGIS